MDLPPGLSGRNPVALLLSEARTKPLIADLVKRAPTMSPEEIETVTVPLPWYRKALKQYIETIRQEEVKILAEKLADDMGSYVDITPQVGMIARYTGLGEQITPTLKMRISMTVELKQRDLLYIADNEIWLGSISLGNPTIPYDILFTNQSRAEYFQKISTNISH